MDDLFKLENKMTSKEDLKGMASNKDLKGMDSKEDLKGMARKEDLQDLKKLMKDIKHSFILHVEDKEEKEDLLVTFGEN